MDSQESSFFHLTGWIDAQAPRRPTLEVSVPYCIDTDVRLDSGFLTHPSLPEYQSSAKTKLPTQGLLSASASTSKRRLQGKENEIFQPHKQPQSNIQQLFSKLFPPSIPRGFLWPPRSMSRFLTQAIRPALCSLFGGQCSLELQILSLVSGANHLFSVSNPKLNPSAGPVEALTGNW